MKEHKPKTTRPETASDAGTDIKGKVSDSTIIIGNGNVINMGGKKPSSNSPKKGTHIEKSKRSVPIVVAWIGFFATILAALITVFGDQILPDPNSPSLSATVPLDTETMTPSQTSTDTITPVEPSLAVSPATDTPVPSATLVPPVPIGEDWLAGCISALWKAYPSTISPTERGDGCWKEPVHTFSAEHGDLDFLSERASGSAEIYGLFAPLPERGTVSFTIRLRDLDNADLWMGVFAEPDIASQGLLMIIPNGDVQRRVILQKDPFTYETLQGTVALYQGNGFSISFIFETLYARSKVNPSVFVTNQVSIPTTQKWLFLGYKGLKGAYRIEGTFLNFELKENE
ncbi:hypothetical protein FBQ99_17005 [Chloroflexi bacterium CFX2]|nr:hypothetical protein [Chloroflexi bacterium CFX2]